MWRRLPLSLVAAAALVGCRTRTKSRRAEAGRTAAPLAAVLVVVVVITMPVAAG